MINRYAYISMTGAKASTEQLAVTSNNLANGLTPGFKEVISAFRAVPLRGDGEPFKGNGADSRVFAIDRPLEVILRRGLFKLQVTRLMLSLRAMDFLLCVDQMDKKPTPEQVSSWWMKTAH